MTQIRNIARPTWAGAILLALVAFAALIGMRAGDVLGAPAPTIGNAVFNRPGSATVPGYVIIDSDNPATAAGTLRQIEVFAANPGDFHAILFDPGTSKVKYVSPLLSAASGLSSHFVSAPVQAGWYIGYYVPVGSAFSIDVTFSPAEPTLEYEALAVVPSVGQTLTLTNDGLDYQASIRGVYGCGATCYVNAVTGNDSNDGQSPASAFLTIQRGADLVNSGGTVIVAPGNYNSFTLINQPLTLNGPNVGIAGNGVRGPEATTHIISVNADNVTVNGFRFVGNGSSYSSTVSGQTNVLLTNNFLDGAYGSAYIICTNLCTFSRNLVTNTGSGSGLYIIGFGVTVANNEFRDNNTLFTNVILAAGASSLNIVENYLHDNDYDCGFPCVGEFPISATGSSNVSILRNTIISANMGIVLFGGNTGVIIKNNFLHASKYAFWSNYTPSSGVTVQENSILSTTNGMEFSAGHTGPFDATKNWWGDKTGPSGDGPGSGTPIDDLSGQVDFDPWLCLGSDTAPLVPGFQPNLSQQATGTTPCDTSPPIATVTFTTVGGTFVAWPGGWNKNRVIATFTCSDPESGIDENSLPRNLTFTGDGQFTVGIHGLSDDDECVNGMGLVAAPVPVAAVTFRIDRQAPSCASTPSTQYITKLTGFQAVTLPVTTQDGFWTGTETKELISITGDKGATSGDWSGFGTLPVDDVTGTFNTAVKGRTYTLTYKVTDLAGWSDTCTSKVRVTN